MAAGAEPGGIQILYVDDDLLAIAKPAGLLTLPDGYDATKPHLQALLQPRFGRLWIVHRLDRGTSGVLLLARTADAHRALNAQFEGRRVTKLYHALVTGRPDWAEREADQPLRVDGDRRHRTVADAVRGKPARTAFRVLKAYPAAALLEARPFTGYTHQIRAHLRALGLALAGDALYALPGSPPPPPGLERTALHALRLEFTHPRDGRPLACEAPYPPDFAAVLDFYRAQVLG